MDPSSTSLAALAPALSVASCLGAVGGIVLARRRPNVREGISVGAALANFALVVWMYLQHRAGVPLGMELVGIAPGLALAFRVDDLGVFFALTSGVLWIVNTVYSIGYMRAHDEPRQTRFYACFAIAIAAVMGAAFAANLFTLFVFYEVLTLCTYPLVIHAETPEARAGARRYLAYLLGLSITFQLPALFLVMAYAPSLDFVAGGFLGASGMPRGLAQLSFVFFLLGLAKSGLMPVHAWLPAAMVAPTPVSALLHAVAVVKMGVFAVSRVALFVFGTDLLRELGVDAVLVGAAGFTVVVASVMALAQDNLKRRLAFSTISQLSYILLGVGLLVPVGVTGGLLHIAVHAFSKITLFFAAGAIYLAAHKTRVSELDGLGRTMPVTSAALTAGALSMIGVPPAAGLATKWLLVQGAVEADQPLVLAVLASSTLLNAAYFLPILWRIWLRPLPAGAPTTVHEAPWPCVAALSTTGLATVALFFWPQPFLDLARAVASTTGVGP